MAVSPARRLAHEADEHLGFAAARHTVEQVFPLSTAQIRQHDRQRFLLPRREGRVRDGGVRAYCRPAGAALLLPAGQLVRAASIWRSACSGSRTSSFNSSTGCVRPSDKTVSSRRRFGERFSASAAASSISRGFADCATVCVFT